MLPPRLRAPFGDAGPIDLVEHAPYLMPLTHARLRPRTRITPTDTHEGMNVMPHAKALI